MLATWRIGPASQPATPSLPPEWAPLTASLLADITHDGLPAGVFNVVQGTGAQAGAPLTAHPGIRRLAFTGSVPTAGVIAKAAAPNIVPLSLSSAASRRWSFSPTPISILLSAWRSSSSTIRARSVSVRSGFWSKTRSPIDSPKPCWPRAERSCRVTRAMRRPRCPA